MASSPRTTPEVVAARRREGDRPASRARPVPVGTALRAPLEGQEVAVTRLAQRAGPREGPPLQPRVARTAGADARMEPSGLRWTTVGAPTVLDLRAVRLNGPWEASRPCHRHPPHARWSGRSVPASALAEARALPWAT
jgi:hypothetical protein